MIVMANKSAGLREALIQAGIHEIHTNGVAAFSIRRVAEACGVSCAAGLFAELCLLPGPLQGLRDAREDMHGSP